MCGIFGFNTNKDTASTAAYFSALAHRGPDAQAAVSVDAWTLGHLRLSIIDTSEGANQPFHKDENWLIFNGEIYNYLELKDKYLSDTTLATESDTEVLITLLNRKGIQVLNELNGMFAFAWYHSGEQTLYLVRDRFGVKPLYYTTYEANFYFASEIRPLAKTRGAATLDDSIVRTFMEDTATDFDERSGIENIFQVTAGHYLTVKSDEEVQDHQWYNGTDYTVPTAIFKDRTATLAAFEALLTDAIALRHRSDVPVCITLSGGLDSTTLYVLAKEKLGSKIRPFVFAHPGAATDESDRAIALAKKYGDEPVIINSDPARGIPALTEALYHLEYPIWNPSAIAYLEMYRAIKARGYTVVIEGHGSDEQLGGYPYMIEAAWKQALLTGKLRYAYTLYQIYLATNNPALEQGNGTAPSKIQCLFRMAKGLVRGIAKTVIWPSKYKYLNFNTLVRESFAYRILPIVLRTFDRLSMAASLESRCPFMDYRVVEFLRALPMEYKVNELGSKAILREILKKYGHKEIYTVKAKMGFAADLPALFNHPDNRNYFKQAIQDFNHPAYADHKALALNSIRKPTLGWSDVAMVWKVAAIAMIEKHYAKPDRI